jgi:uncharacterized protein
MRSEEKATNPDGTGWRADCKALARARAAAEGGENAGQDGAPLAYRWEHVRQVVGLALEIGSHLDTDGDVLLAAAWLHDICKGQPNHAAAGAAEARSFLATTDFPPEKIVLVVAAIAQHEGLTRPESAPPLAPLEAAVLWDADKASKLGVSAVALALSAPQVEGATLAERRRYVDGFARGVLAQTVQSMNTAPGRALAQRRYAAMLAALDAWAQDEDEAQVDLHSFV